MTKKQVWLALVIALITPPCVAESISISFQPLPDRAVETVMEIDSQQELDGSGDDELIRRNKLRGITFPFKSRTKSKQVMCLVSGPVDAKGDLEIKMTIKEAQSITTDRIGQELSIPHSAAKMVGVTTVAKMNAAGQWQFIRVEGKSLTREIENLARQVLPAVLSASKGLEGRVLTVGESFDQNFSIEIPMTEDKKIGFNAITKYTLRELKDGLALISFVTSFSLPEPKDGMFSESAGSSFGNMQYNVKKKLIIRSASTSRFDLSVKYGIASLLMRSKSTEVLSATEVNP